MSPSSFVVSTGGYVQVQHMFCGQSSLGKKDRREITEARTSRHETGGRRDEEGRIETPNSFARLKSRSHE